MTPLRGSFIIFSAVALALLGAIGTGQEITADLVFKRSNNILAVVNRNLTELLNVAVQHELRSNVLEKRDPAESDLWPANFYSGPKQEQTSFTPSDTNYFFEFSFTPFSVFAGVHSSIQVFSNGYMTFDGSDNYFLREPPSTFEQYPFSYIAPFWSSSFSYDDESRIVYSVNRLNFGLDAKLNKTANRSLDHLIRENLFKKVNDDINKFLELKSSNLTSRFSAQVIILVEWLKLKLLDEQVSFQVAIASNYDTQQSYLVINYNKKSLPSPSFSHKSSKIKCLIGHKNLKKNYQYVNLFSNSINSTNTGSGEIKLADPNPMNIFDEKGNTGRREHFVFDISYKANDTCLNWFNLMQLSTNYTTRVQEAIKKNSYLRCPCTSVQAQNNNYFLLFQSQKDFNTVCYKMNFNVNKDILEKIANDETMYLAKQLCCYDINTGSLTETSERAGFVYVDKTSPSEDTEIFANLRDECCSKETSGNNCNRFYSVHPINTCNGGIDLLSLPDFEMVQSAVPNKPSQLQKIRLSNALPSMSPDILSKINSYKPPLVKFRNETLNLNWHKTLNETVELVVDIIDDELSQEAKSNRTIELVVHNKRLVTKSADGAGPERSIVTASSSSPTFNFFQKLTTHGLTTTIKFSYVPVANEIPIFSVMITDNYLNLTTVETLGNLRVCDCNQRDKKAVCLIDKVLETLESNIESLACKCSRSYTGKYCDQLKDYCLVQPCSHLSNTKCFNLSPEQQLAQNKSFVCCKSELTENGTCKHNHEKWSGFLPKTFFLFSNLNDDVKIIFDVFVPVIAFIFVLSLLFMVIFIMAEKRKLKLLSKGKNKLTPFETNTNATSSIASYGDENMIIKPTSSRKLIDYIGSGPLAKLNYNLGGRPMRMQNEPSNDVENGADDCVITDTYRSHYNIATCNLNGTLQMSHTSSSSQLASRVCSDSSAAMPMVNAVSNLKNSSSTTTDSAKGGGKLQDDKIFIKSLEERAANCQRITITKPNSVIANSQKIYPTCMKTSAYYIGQSNDSYFMNTNDTTSTACQMDELIKSAGKLANLDLNKRSPTREKGKRMTADVAIETDLSDFNLIELSKSTQFNGDEIGRKPVSKSPSNASNHLGRNIFVLDQFQAPRIKIPRPKY